MNASSPVPDHIGRYQILERVGQGGMGVLYRGFDPKLDREVAIKVMLTDFSEDAESMRPRFYREAKAVAKLQHRNIVTVFEFVEDQQQPHIVMEFLRGVALGSRMKSAPGLTLDDKLDIVAQLCSGLGYAHSQGVVHRDVKPANVFLLEDGTVKLLDFGIAKLTTSTLTRQGDVLGSASYMSPEQVAGSDSVDGRADVWSAGVVLYELLSGRKPFEGENPTNVIVKILKEEPPPIDLHVPGLPKRLIAAVHHALEKDPTKRIAKADELGRELQWIRKMLLASGQLAPMEETRFASTQVLKALSDDIKKLETGQIKMPARAGDVTQPAIPLPAPASSKKWIVPVGAAVVVVAAVAGYLALGGPSSSRTATDAPARAVTSSATTAATPTPEAPAPVAAKPTPPSSMSSNSTPRGADPAATKKPAVARAVSSVDPSADAGTKSVAETRKPLAPAAPTQLVKVSMTGPYVFEVMDGSRSISAPSKSHELAPQPAGKTLRVVAPEVFLDQQVRVDGGLDNLFEYTAPGLGRLDIRAARQDCKVMVGKHDFGYPPLAPVPVVAGEYQITLACPDGQNPVKTATVTPGRPVPVRFQN
jgi:serine/threonine protein kinase